MTPPAYNAWRLVSLSPLPLWAMIALGAAIVAGVALAAWGVRKESALGKKLVLWSLRFLAAICAFFFLLEPGLRRMQVAQVKNRVAVLVDRSASMSFPTAVGQQNRGAAVADYLDKVAERLDALKDRYHVELYGFSPELSALTPETLRTQPGRAGQTDLLAALRSLKAGSSGNAAKRLSGVLLFSDGADNQELAGGVSGRLKSALQELETPVSTFLVGEEGLRDISIEGVKVDDFAFVRNSLTVEVDVRGRGYKGQKLTVVLAKDGQIVATKSLDLTSADQTQAVPFTFTPDQTGRFVYTVNVQVLPDEIVTENNTRSFALKVIRDRVRVLLVVGRPTWDERFLRGLLKQDPNVDLVSFYILRTMSDDPMVRNPDRELSLIPFPMEEIFDTKLSTFDVVIFQNFGYTDPQLSIAQYEKKLERYIHEGGAFVMIGGDRAFGEGRAIFPTLSQAMPVEPLGLPAQEAPFKARLTAEGQRHPVTALGSGAASTEAAWASLPAMPGVNLTRARPGATVLLDHPFQTSNGKNIPVVALWDYGRGRALTLTSDGSWFWAFGSHASGVPARHYDRFWGNALRWLVRDPDLTTLKVNADPPSVEPGKPVVATVAARLSDYQPAADAQVTVELYSVQSQKIIAKTQAVTGPEGVARVEFPPPEPGAYKLLGSAQKGGQSLGQGEDALAVRAVGSELSDASVRPKLLEEIARATGGKAYQLPLEGFPEVPLLEPPVVEVGRSKDEPLWDRWYYLCLLVTVLGAEWFLRRRFGYL